MMFQKIEPSQYEYLMRTRKYDFVGALLLSPEIRLCVSHPSMSRVDAKSILRRNFGEPTELDHDGVSFEYVFITPDHPNDLFRIYDWKGSMSCGFGLYVGTTRLSPPHVNALNESLKQLLEFAYIDIPSVQLIDITPKIRRIRI